MNPRMDKEDQLSVEGYERRLLFGRLFLHPGGPRHWFPTTVHTPWLGFPFFVQHTGWLLFYVGSDCLLLFLYRKPCSLWDGADLSNCD